jgi:hypothetical protein
VQMAMNDLNCRSTLFIPGWRLDDRGVLLIKVCNDIILNDYGFEDCFVMFTWIWLQ